MSRSDALYARACEVMPAGVNSPVRAFRAVGGSPRFVAEGAGCWLVDADGHRLVDWVCSWGALILGHAHPAVVEAATEALRRGSSYGAPHEGEVLLAEAVREAMPAVEMLRFVSSGTEAVMSAVRLARGATSRPCIVKFDGCYHGHADALLAKAGSGVATFGLPDSAGVPPETTAHTLVAPYNDAEAVAMLLERNAGRVAAILVEPVAGNMGVVPPADGFLPALRRLATEHGALLIFDEVMSGFRVARGGACERFGVRPDLVALGKVVGGGMPAAAYGGRRNLMEQVAPLGPVYQAGTLSGNPVAMAAGLATLRLLDAPLYEGLERVSGRLADGLSAAAAEAGVPAQVNRVGSMLSVFFTDRAVTDMASASSTDRTLFARVFHGLLERGVYAPPSALEAWFVSAAHSDAEVDATVAAFREALRDAAARGPSVHG